MALFSMLSANPLLRTVQQRGHGLTTAHVLQFARPELALQYEEALRTAGLTSIDSVIRDMGAGDSPALEVGEFDVNRGTRLMILGFNRVQLVRCPLFQYLVTCAGLTRLEKDIHTPCKGIGGQ